LLPALYVHAYVRRNKTDAADAAALIEATRCSEIRPVPVKTIEQQQLLQLHRLREQYKRTRNARVNLLRGAFREFGIPLPSGLTHSIRALSDLVHLSPSEMPKELAEIYGRVLEDIEQLQKKLNAVDSALSHLTRTDPVVRGLVTICGMGPIIATAIRASVGEIERFPTDIRVNLATRLPVAAAYPPEWARGHIRRRGGADVLHRRCWNESREGGEAIYTPPAKTVVIRVKDIDKPIMVEIKQ
jgi:transposase